MGKILSLRRTHVLARLRHYKAELGRRYQGILYEILDSAGIPEQDRVLTQVKAWQMTQSLVRREPEPWRVPGLLWSCCTSFGSLEDSDRRRLKRKLMLRAFIEEIPDSPDRMELLRLAYQAQGAEFQDFSTDEQALQRLSRILPLLQRQLLDADRLYDWTDGALSPEEVAAMASPYPAFKEWLFEL